MHTFVHERAAKETRDIIKFAGFQGVHAWVLVGFIISVLNFGLAYVRAHYPADVDYFKNAIDNAHSKLEATFSAMTVLCVYNMILICRFEPIKDALLYPSLKFL